MVCLKCLIIFCLCNFLNVQAFQNNDNGTVNMKHQLKQLEETVSNLQNHMLAQEQKQTAVLSSVLSRLTDTADELVELKHNHTEELAKLQQNYIDEIARLQQNYTVLESEVSSLKDNCTPVDNSGFGGQQIAFEANMAKKGEHISLIQFLANSTLIFPRTKYNEGGCWNPSTGTFTASVTGTYLFWIELTCTHVKTLTLSMKRNKEDFGKAYGYVDFPVEPTLLSLTSLTHLTEGDEVRFVANKNVSFWPNVSSCGGVLLHSGQE